MMHAKSLLMLYPNYFNQTSFSTNNLEAGEHIHSKSVLKHDPIDYTVPLFGPGDIVELSSSSYFFNHHKPPIVLDLFAKPTSMRELQRRGKDWCRRSKDPVLCAD